MYQDSVFVGVDYAQAFVQVCVLDRDGRLLANRRCENSWLAIATLVRRHGRRVRAAIESCTGAADLAEQLMHWAGWSLDLAHPGYVHRIKQNPDKSDFSDARLLADLVRVGYLPRVWLAPQCIRELRRLVRHRQDLVDRRRAVKLRVSALLRDHRCRSPEGHSWTQRWRRWLASLRLPAQSRWVIDEMTVEVAELQGRIARVEQRLTEVTQTDSTVEALQTWRGVGLVTACVIRAEIGDATRFRTGKQLSRYCGLTPRNASSGLRQADAGLITASNRYLRATLIEAAHRLLRYDPRWKAFAARHLARGKPKCVVIAAAANRWVRGLYHELVRLRPAA
jgi:transposase